MDRKRDFVHHFIKIPIIFSMLVGHQCWAKSPSEIIISGQSLQRLAQESLASAGARRFHIQGNDAVPSVEVRGVFNTNGSQSQLQISSFPVAQNEFHTFRLVSGGKNLQSARKSNPPPRGDKDLSIEIKDQQLQARWVPSQVQMEARNIELALDSLQFQFPLSTLNTQGWRLRLDALRIEGRCGSEGDCSVGAEVKLPWDAANKQFDSNQIDAEFFWDPKNIRLSYLSPRFINASGDTLDLHHEINEALKKNGMTLDQVIEDNQEMILNALAPTIQEAMQIQLKSVVDLLNPKIKSTLEQERTIAGKDWASVVVDQVQIFNDPDGAGYLYGALTPRGCSPDNLGPAKAAQCLEGADAALIIDQKDLSRWLKDFFTAHGNRYEFGKLTGEIFNQNDLDQNPKIVIRPDGRLSLKIDGRFTAKELKEGESSPLQANLSTDLPVRLTYENGVLSLQPEFGSNGIPDRATLEKITPSGAKAKLDMELLTQGNRSEVRMLVDQEAVTEITRQLFERGIFKEILGENGSIPAQPQIEIHEQSGDPRSMAMRVVIPEIIIDYKDNDSLIGGAKDLRNFKGGEIIKANGIVNLIAKIEDSPEGPKLRMYFPPKDGIEKFDIPVLNVDNLKGLGGLLSWTPYVKNKVNHARFRLKGDLEDSLSNKEITFWNPDDESWDWTHEIFAGATGSEYQTLIVTAVEDDQERHEMRDALLEQNYDIDYQLNHHRRANEEMQSLFGRDATWLRRPLERRRRPSPSLNPQPLFFERDPHDLSRLLRIPLDNDRRLQTEDHFTGLRPDRSLSRSHPFLLLPSEQPPGLEGPYIFYEFLKRRYGIKLNEGEKENPDLRHFTDEQVTAMAKIYLEQSGRFTWKSEGLDAKNVVDDLLENLDRTGREMGLIRLPASSEDRPERALTIISPQQSLDWMQESLRRSPEITLPGQQLEALEPLRRKVSSELMAMGDLAPRGMLKISVSYYPAEFTDSDYDPYAPGDERQKVIYIEKNSPGGKKLLDLYAKSKSRSQPLELEIRRPKKESTERKHLLLTDSSGKPHSIAHWDVDLHRYLWSDEIFYEGKKSHISIISATADPKDPEKVLVEVSYHTSVISWEDYGRSMKRVETKSAQPTTRQIRLDRKKEGGEEIIRALSRGEPLRLKFENRDKTVPVRMVYANNHGREPIAEFPLSALRMDANQSLVGFAQELLGAGGQKLEETHLVTLADENGRKRAGLSFQVQHEKPPWSIPLQDKLNELLQKHCGGFIQSQNLEIEMQPEDGKIILRSKFKAGR